jgi:hypothetical protein
MLADGLAGLLVGNTTPIWDSNVAIERLLQLNTSSSNGLCNQSDDEDSKLFHSGTEVQTAYICNDGRAGEKPKQDLSWARGVLEKNLESGPFGGVLAGFEVGCA